MSTNINNADKSKGPLVIQNFVVGRPPVRTTYTIEQWRNALIYAEMDSGNRVSLYDLYADVLLDPHLTSQWEKRVENITNTDLIFTVNGQEVDEINTLLDSPEFEQLISEIMNAVAWGISVVELGSQELVECDEKATHLTVYNVLRKHIWPRQGLIVKEQYGGTDGAIQYREGQYQNYVAEVGKPDDLGLLLKAAPMVLIKRGDVGDWAQFAQIFGMPFREFRYDGYDKATEMKLQKMAEEMGSAPYVILPTGATITLHEVKGNANGDVYKNLAAFCDEQISILILGNTETTKSSDSSGYAQSAVHMETQESKYLADKKRVRRILNRTIRPILFNLGFPVKGGFFSFKEEVSTAQRLDRMNIVQAVKLAGAPVEDDYIYEQSGVPKPANYDSLKNELQQQQVSQSEARPGNGPARPADNGDRATAKTGGGKAGKVADKKSKGKKNLVHAFRTALADFFDPAP